MGTELYVQLEKPVEVKSLNLKTFEPIGNKPTETTFCTSDFFFRFFNFEKFGYDFVEKREKFVTSLNVKSFWKFLKMISKKL